MGNFSRRGAVPSPVMKTSTGYGGTAGVKPIAEPDGLVTTLSSFSPLGPCFEGESSISLDSHIYLCWL